MWGIGYNSETDVLPDFPDVLSDLQSPQPASTRTQEENFECAFPPPIILLGVPFAHVHLSDAVAEIEAMIRKRKPHYVVTANVDFLVQSMHDHELHRIMLEADQVVCDGTPLIWSSRLLGNPLPERVAGADLVPLLLAKSAERGYRIFFLGGEESVARRAVQNVEAKYPGVQICGHYSPPFKPLLEMDHDDIISRIRAARPDILLVSFGCPKAEKWINMHYRKLDVPVSIGVGGTIDFLAGKLKRAPQWMQQSGLEWLYRLSQEPRRLYKRYGMDLSWFGRAFATQYLVTAMSRKEDADARNASVSLEPAWRRITLPEVFDRSSILRDQDVWTKCPRNHHILDLSQVRCIDSTALGLMVQLHKNLRRQDFFLLLLKPSRPVQRALKALRLDGYFLMAEDVHSAYDMIRKRREEAEILYHHSAYHHTFPLLWRGEITACNTEEVWTQIEAELSAIAGFEEHVPIDLSEVRFIDSAGVGLLARTKKHAERLGMSVRFISVPVQVGNVLRLSKMDSLMEEQK